MSDHLDDAALDAIEARVNEWDCECDYATRPDNCGIPEHEVTYCVDHLCESDPCPLDERGLPADIRALVAEVRRLHDAAEVDASLMRSIIAAREHSERTLTAERDAAIARAEALERRLFPGQGDSYANEVERQRNVIDGLQHATRSAIARAEAAEATIAAVRALHPALPIRLGPDAGKTMCGSCDPDEGLPCPTIRALDTGATT